jgi:hypothetical protein
MKMHNGNLWYAVKNGHFFSVFEYSMKKKVSYIKGMIESEDFCFYKNEFWSCSDNTIVSGFMNAKTGATEVLDLEKYGIKKPSRITVSPDEKKLAVVSSK